MNNRLITDELLKIAKNLVAKRIVITVDWNDESSIRKAERQKAKLENEGYKLVQTTGGLFTSSLIYEK